MTFNPKLCDERHDNIGKEFQAVWKRLNGQDRKLWIIIALHITTLLTVIGFLATK